MDPRQSFFIEKIAVSPIPMNHQSLRQKFAELIAPLLVLLNNLDLYSHWQKLLRQIICSLPTADNHTAFYTVRGHPNFAEKFIGLLWRRHYRDHILFPKLKISVRDKYFLTALYSTDQHITVKPA